MAMPVIKMQKELYVEERVATLEAHVGHILEDISEMKSNALRLEGKVDALNGKVDALFGTLNGKVDALKDSIATLSLNMEKSVFRLTLWATMLYITLAAGLLFVVARGLKWL